MKSLQSTLGKGPAITFMDSTYIAQRQLLDRIVNIAKEAKIPYQFKRAVSGEPMVAYIQPMRVYQLLLFLCHAGIFTLLLVWQI